MKKFTSTAVIFAVIICIVGNLIETDAKGGVNKDPCVNDCNECRIMCEGKGTSGGYNCQPVPTTKKAKSCHCNGFGDLIPCHTMKDNKPNDAVGLSTFGSFYIAAVSTFFNIFRF